MNTRVKGRVLLVVGAALMCVAPIHAVDGVIEINHAKAIAGGVTAGDTPGYPVTISAAGSYRLTSDLDVTVAAVPEDTDGLDVNVEYVTVDLNGFSIIGPGTAGTGQGIDAQFFDRVTVRNGFVRDMGSDGVRLRQFSRVDGVIASGNGGHGISTSGGSVVINCIAYTNGGDGIASHQGVIQNNTSYDNVGDGIDGNNGSSVIGNSATSNGGDGIEVRFESTVIGNAMRLNDGFGLNVPQGTSGYADNAIGTNFGGTVGGGGVEIGMNLCGNNATCP